MPLFAVQLDASGVGQWIPPRKLTELTVINQGSSAVSFYVNDHPPRITLNTNIEVEFETREAGEVVKLGFVSGPANGQVMVSWA